MSFANFPDFKDVAPGKVPDFQVENVAKRSVTYFTPYTQAAKDWCARYMKLPMHGRSYMVAMANGRPSEQSGKLKAFMRREGFTVSR